MIFDFIYRKKSVIRGWILSYTLIILIPVMFTGIAYLLIGGIIEDEIDRSNDLVLANIRDNNDNILSNVERFSMELSTSSSINEVISIQDKAETANYIIYEASRSLSNYKLFNSYLRGFYIHFNDLKIVVTPGVVFEDDIYRSVFLPSDSNINTHWQKMMNTRHNGVYRLMPYLDEVNGAMNTVAYLRSIPVSSVDSFSATLVVLLDMDGIAMGKDGWQDLSDERSLFILDSNGEVMVKTGDEEVLTGLDYNKLLDSKGKTTEIIADEKYILSYTTSRVNGWKYIIATPEAVFWEKAKFIRTIIIAGLIFGVFLSTFVSVIYLRRNYNPLKEIVKYFQEKLQSETDFKNDEYGVIKRVLNDTLEQKERINTLLEKQNNAMKSAFIASLLKGRETALPVHELLTTYNMSFKHQYFTVMTIYIETMDQDFWNDNNYENVKFDMAKYVITNVVEELVNRNHCGYVTEVDDMLTCLVNLAQGGEDFKDDLLKVMQEANKFFKEYYKLDIIVAIGALHEGIKGIPAAFTEAVQALEYARVMGGEIVVFSEIAQEDGKEYYYPVEKEYQLINCIKSGDYTSAASILEEVITRNTVIHTPSLDMVRCLMFDLASTMLKALNELDKTMDSGFVEGLNPARELLKCETLAEIKEKMLYLLESVCGHISSNPRHVDSRIKESVIQYIEQHLSDINLGIASIAEELGKNPYYISRVYKEHTGEGILEYINKLRIEKAKELIKENKWNQEEIAAKVGYSNIRTFHRAFKKVEGTTPGKVKA